MEFKIEKASGAGIRSQYSEKREIRTIEDLLKLAEEHPTKQGRPEDLVLMFNGWGGVGDPTIVIYDDYIE